MILFCYILSAGHFDEDQGVVWWLAGIYYWTAALPVLIASIVFGIKGLKSNNRIPSYKFYN